jgi:NlpC/P60 family putative phage cell wall peptidase
MNANDIPPASSLQPLASIAAARACIGTPFHHQGRRPGIGLDCIGLVVVALQAAGIAVRDRVDYGRRPDGKSLTEALAAHGAAPVEEIAAGDVLLFRYDGQPQHAALATSEDAMIHSFAPAGKVVETPIGAYWRRRLVGAYRFNQKRASEKLSPETTLP